MPKKFFILSSSAALFLVGTERANAHVGTPYTLVNTDTFLQKFLSGVAAGTHHIGSGIDHLLFLFMLLLPATAVIRNHRRAFITQYFLLTGKTGGDSNRAFYLCYRVTCPSSRNESLLPSATGSLRTHPWFGFRFYAQAISSLSKRSSTHAVCIQYRNRISTGSTCNADVAIALVAEQNFLEYRSAHLVCRARLTLGRILDRRTHWLYWRIRA